MWRGRSKDSQTAFPVTGAQCPRPRSIFLLVDKHCDYPTLIVVPSDAGFFVAVLADMQRFIPRDEIPEGFATHAVIYVTLPSS